MDGIRFDALAQGVGRAASRRGVVRALAAGVLGATALAAGGGPAEAACRKPGKSCKRDGQCCSGRCAGKKGKKRCKPAPIQGICTIADNACFADDIPDVVCGTADAGQCLCFVTVGGEAFCADAFGSGNTGCAKDADCVDALGAGARCIESSPACGDQRVCKLPCPIILEPIP